MQTREQSNEYQAQAQSQTTNMEPVNKETSEKPTFVNYELPNL